jgi:hypothetical protein
MQSCLCGEQMLACIVFRNSENDEFVFCSEITQGLVFSVLRAKGKAAKVLHPDPQRIRRLLRDRIPKWSGIRSESLVLRAQLHLHHLTLTLYLCVLFNRVVVVIVVVIVFCFLVHCRLPPFFPPPLSTRVLLCRFEKAALCGGLMIPRREVLLVLQA